MTALLISLGVFFALQGVILDLVLLIISGLLVWFYFADRRQQKREERQRGARAVAMAETILFESRSQERQ